MSIQGKVGPNKAARQSLADRLTTEQSSFDASAGLLTVQVEKKNPKEKPKKAPDSLHCSTIIPSSVYSLRYRTGSLSTCPNFSIVVYPCDFVGLDPWRTNEEGVPKGPGPVPNLHWLILAFSDLFSSNISPSKLRLSTLGNKARLAAQSLTDYKIANQEDVYHIF